MTTTTMFRMLLTTTALAALIGGAPVGDALGQAAQSGRQASATQPPAATLATQQTALDALAEAHKAARRDDGHSALEQIERAETALLNLEQIAADPRIEHSLLRLDLARSAVNRKDMRVADELLASSAHSLTGAFAVAAAAMPSGTAPVSDAVQPDQIRATRMIGQPIYDANDQALGNVVDLVLDADGTVDAVVIGIPGAGGLVIKNVAVPMSEVRGDGNHRTIERTRGQMQQASNYQLDRQGATSASGGRGATTPTGSGAAGTDGRRQ